MAEYKVHRTIQQVSNYVVNGMAATVTPAGNNQAGVPWATVAAEQNALFWAQTAGEPPFPLPPALRAELEAGTKFIWTWSVSFPTSSNNQQAVNAIESEIVTQEAAQLARLTERLRYWGFTGTT